MMERSISRRAVKEVLLRGEIIECTGISKKPTKHTKGHKKALS
jgi:hypothetical protein